jgi:AsmA-like C-terminal region
MSKTVKRWLILAPAIVLAGVVLLFVTARIFAAKFEPKVRSLTIRYLEERFDGRVTLGNLQIRLPNVSLVGLLLRGGSGAIARVEGRNLAVSYQGRSDIPPLLTVALFQCNLDLGMLRRTQPRVARVTLDGVKIVIPPKNDTPHPKNTRPESGSGVIIDTLDLSNSSFVVLPKTPGRKPLAFALREVHLHYAGIGQQMKYEAILANPRPPGQIHSHGNFGPWNRDDPGDTPLEGDYDFSDADLGVFKAIAGTLHSSGQFAGTLSAVSARGEATVPDFRLKGSGNRVPLETHFDAVIDGTNGNTILQPVQARLLNTQFQTSGAIIKHDPNGRRAIDLDLVIPQGHLEDLLLLAMKGKPFMSGLVGMRAKISIPPLGGDVKEKLMLAGTFDIAHGAFLRDNVRDKVDELSRRGQGRPNDENVDNVFSHMAGTFSLQDEVMTFNRLDFEVPGAAVALHGQYRLSDDVLDFHGTLKLQAEVSETLAGWKHWLAVPLDPFFAKNGAGTFLKIQVVGSAKKPEFGRDHRK